VRGQKRDASLEKLREYKQRLAVARQESQRIVGSMNDDMSKDTLRPQELVAARLATTHTSKPKFFGAIPVDRRLVPNGGSSLITNAVVRGLPSVGPSTATGLCNLAAAKNIYQFRSDKLRSLSQCGFLPFARAAISQTPVSNTEVRPKKNRLRM
jgi:hypothetical protein